MKTYKARHEVDGFVINATLKTNGYQPPLAATIARLTDHLVSPKHGPVQETPELLQDGEGSKLKVTVNTDNVELSSEELSRCVNNFRTAVAYWLLRFWNPVAYTESRAHKDGLT